MLFFENLKRFYHDPQKDITFVIRTIFTCTHTQRKLKLDERVLTSNGCLYFLLYSVQFHSISFHSNISHSVLFHSVSFLNCWLVKTH